jgi:ribosomal protein S8
MQKLCEMVQSLLKTTVSVQRAPYHPLNIQALNVLQNEGLIRGFVVEGNRINILLKHYLGAPVIRNVTIVSRPSREIFMSPHELKQRTSFNSGLWLVHTPSGVVTHREAIEMGVAGRCLFGINIGSQRWV